jgi:hypothetical protein
MLEQEMAFYEAHKDEFHEKYLHKWLIIANESLFGVYSTLHEAAETAFAHFEPGEFMLHTPADDGKIVEIGPIVQRTGDDQDAEPLFVEIFPGALVTVPHA